MPSMQQPITAKNQFLFCSIGQNLKKIRIFENVFFWHLQALFFKESLLFPFFTVHPAISFSRLTCCHGNGGCSRVFFF